MTLVEGGSPPARPWTEEELERLRRLVEADGPGAWEEKLPHFPGRSAKGLESKYYKALLQEPDEGAAPGPAPAAPPSKRARKCAACSGKHDCAHTCGMAQPADAPSEGATPRENATPPRLAAAAARRARRRGCRRPRRAAAAAVWCTHTSASTTS